MSVPTVCTWASKANASRVLEERTGPKAWNRLVNSVRLVEPPNSPALPTSKNARCPSACQVKILNDCRVCVSTAVTKSLANRMPNGICRVILEHYPEQLCLLQKGNLPTGHTADQLFAVSAEHEHQDSGSRKYMTTSSRIFIIVYVMKCVTLGTIRKRI